MRTSSLLAAAAALALGCSSGTASPPADAGTARDGSAADAQADANLSGIDAGGCPHATPESFLGFDPSYVFLRSGSWQQDRAFYLFTLLDGLPDAAAAVAADPTLSGLVSAHAAALSTAATTCNGDLTCLGNAVPWSTADITAAGNALAALASSPGPLATLVASHLRPSGHAQLHAADADPALLQAAWTDAASALNLAWTNYVAILPPATVTGLVQTAASGAASAPFYRPLLGVVLAGLVADNRLEATLYEPLTTGENAAVLAHIPTIDFAKYPFPAIVVPGLGPTSLATPLSPGGQMRCDSAAARYRAGLAPIVILSGGHVHPDRTPYSEAIEMKQYLMKTYAIPERDLMVDPYARHTTTNLRNVARLMVRSGIPVDRGTLVTSDEGQTIYIAASGPTDIFGARCTTDLGYTPYRGMIPQLDLLDDCWVPSVTSVFVDARDPLDP